MGVSTENAHHVALAVVSRRRLLDVLQSADEPLDVAALAQAELRLPVAEQAGLRPFVEPDLCIADVPIPPRPGDQP